jgi:nucleoside-diphosphate-sugar epimerase
MKISILGCGWLGLPLAKSLLSDEHEVMGSTTTEEKLELLRAEGIEPYLISVSSTITSLPSGFLNTQILIIAIPPNRKSGGTDEYLLTLHRLADIVEKGSVRHIVFVSSTSVYPETNGVVCEGDESPDSYMVKAEKIITRQIFNTTIIRFGGLFGPHRHPGRFLAGKKDVAGADSPVNMIHLDDAIAVVKSVIDHNGWNEVFNACADEHPTRATFYTRMAVNAGLPPPVFLHNDKKAFKIVSSERLKTRLGYKFIVSNPLLWNE